MQQDQREFDRLINEPVESLFGAQDLETLSLLVCKVARENMIVVEVGTWVGGSTTALVNAAESFNGVVYCIDHWLGSVGEKGEQTTGEKVDVFQVFKARMLRLHHWESIRVMYMSSTEAARVFKDGIVDLVFIDADHRYEEVRKDISSWLPKIRPGGIICGHDFGILGVNKAVNELLSGVTCNDMPQVGRSIWIKHL